MQVRVRLFAGLHDIAGQRSLAVDLPDGATVAQLREEIARRYPVLAPHLPTAVCAVNEDYVDIAHKLCADADVALIPPVSGGAAEETGNREPGTWAASEQDTLISVTAEPLDPERVTAAVRCDEAGAVLVFQGVARNHSEGRRVIALEYDAYPEMAVRKLREVAQDVRARWPITGIAVQHRTGRLAIGEASLLVAVSSAHRAEAFEACLYAVDRIKQTVPVWKKEIWEDGDGAWVAGHAVDVADPPR
jgi:molybdopterin synthase catalytic subunit